MHKVTVVEDGLVQREETVDVSLDGVDALLSAMASGRRVAVPCDGKGQVFFRDVRSVIPRSEALAFQFAFHPKYRGATR